jgi:hypothetical protein
LLREIAYLEQRATGLGRRLFTEVQRAERFVTQFPQASPEISPGIRKRLLWKFPYSLIYSVEDEVLLVLALAHHRRRPGYWLDRGGQGGPRVEHE